MDRLINFISNNLITYYSSPIDSITIFTFKDCMCSLYIANNCFV